MGKRRLILVGHDPDYFLEESFKMMKIPRSINRKIRNRKSSCLRTTSQGLTIPSAWHKYNEGLLKLSDADRTTGVTIAPGCGPFIQKDNPQFVAAQLESLLEKIQSGL